jgi:hypothetical protein
MNPFLFVILLFVAMYILDNFIRKLKANRLLKIIYRLIYFEKREIFFEFSQSNNREGHNMIWGKNISSSDIKKRILDGLEPEKYINYYGIISSNNIFTYDEFLILCDKFNEYIDKKTNFPEKDEFKKSMNLLCKQRKIFDHSYLFDENEIFEEYFNFCGFDFSPGKIGIENLLKYLKQNLYIRNEYNIQLTEKAYKSLNLPENLDSDFKNYVDVLISNFK